MNIVKLLSGYIVGSLLFLGGTILVFGPGSVQGSTEKSLNASTTILPGNPSASATTQEKASRQESYGRLPLYFIENHGQVDRKVQFYAQGPGQKLAFTSREAVLSLRQGNGKVAQIHLTPVGMQSGINIQALAPQEARFNYLLGCNELRWRTDVPSYGAVLYREAYPGIDLKFYGKGRQTGIRPHRPSRRQLLPGEISLWGRRRPPGGPRGQFSREATRRRAVGPKETRRLPGDRRPAGAPGGPLQALEARRDRIWLCGRRL